ncbi:MAG TPA: cyclic nucleotide-binding domain-containing protein [Gaiellaceae bacterium]|nr:cyclic nucleotide-binding domain-containing protein [Gaiellaceae bacterium]
MPIDTVEALSRVPLLSGLDRKELRRLAGVFAERAFAAGDVVVKQGDERGIGFFVIIEGTARVSANGSDVAVLGPGDHFGEIALLGDRIRTATVTADADLQTLVTTVWDFRAFVKNNPDTAWKLLEHLAGLLAERAPV